MQTSHDKARYAMQKHGVSVYELISELQQQRLCVGSEQKVIDQFVSGGPLAVGLAIALFGVIGRQNYLPKTTH